MKKRLILIRHAQSQANKEGRVQGWLDSELSELGHRHAQLVSAHIAKYFNVSHIFCSPLIRATQTASYLSELLELPLTLIDDLKEQDLGPLTGLTKQEIQHKYPHLEEAWTNNRPRPAMDGLESDAVFSKRVQRAIDRILTIVPEDSSVAVFAHGGTLNQMLKTWLRITDSGRLTFTFNNASITIMDIYAAHVRLVLLNDTHHLGEAYAQRD